MAFFKKKIQFTSAICPKCQGNLRLNTSMDRATCEHCGAECIVENASKQAKKQGKLELVLGFIERQQELHRQDKKEKQEKKKEERKKEQKSAWIWLVALIGIIFLCGIMALLGD